jgi:hypothetical protein
MKTLLFLISVVTLTSCGVSHQVVNNVNYTKEIVTDSTITYVYYDSTIVRIVKK